MNVNGIKLVVPVAGWATQGQYALVEACVEAGARSPPHVGQPRGRGAATCCEGEVEVVADRERRTARGRAGARRSTAGVPRRLRRRARSRACWC